MADLDRNSLGLGDKPALIVVDMIKGFTSAECPLGSDCPEVVAANARLIESFHARDLPVAFTTVVFREESDARVFRDRVPALNVLTPDSDWVQLDERLTRRHGDLWIEKCWASGFFKTDLDAQLRERGVDSVVVTGLTTSGCVRATAVDGLQCDYRVVVPREAVGDRNAEAHAANLFDMNAKYADVLSLDEVLAALDE